MCVPPGLVARKTLTPTLSHGEREKERVPDEIWGEALARVAELDAGSACSSEFLAMANWVARVVGDRIRLRKLRWNTRRAGSWRVDGVRFAVLKR